MNRLENAIFTATMLHTGQTRKYTGLPYVTHPIEVMTIAAELGGMTNDENVLIAAVLHDTVEDTSFTLEEVSFAFGEDVAKLVEELTEVPVEGNRAVRKEAERIRLSKVSDRAKRIKLADLISNTRSITQYDPKFARVYLREKRDLLPVLFVGDYDELWLTARKQVDVGLDAVAEKLPVEPTSEDRWTI